MPKEELQELLNEVQDPADGSIDIRDEPDISEVMCMDHSELLTLLQLCPFSQYFGQSSVKLNLNLCTLEQAQEQAINMIKESAGHVTQSLPKISSLKLWSQVNIAKKIID